MQWQYNSRWLAALLLCVYLAATTPNIAYGSIAKSSRNHPNPGVWSGMIYHGRMTGQPVGRIVRGTMTLENAALYSVETDYQFSDQNIIARFFHPAASHVGLAFNFTYQDDPEGAIYELNPFIYFHWKHLPWERHLPTIIKFGEGVSYATEIPARELRSSEWHDTKRFLNFLVFEIAFYLPQHPQWQTLIRFHHRSGAFGLYGARNNGSTAIGIGLRYRFLQWT